MNEIRETAETLLADKPELEPALRELLRVDEADPEWTFEDVDIDTGQFGELVKTDIVADARDGEAYQLADQDAVRAALSEGDSGESDDGSVWENVTLPSIDVDRRTVGVIVAVLLLTVVLRSLMFRSVFRPEMIILGGNDSYSYRFWVERLLETTRAFDLGALADLPADVAEKDVLYIVTVWWTAALLGGTPSVARTVLAVYPLISAVLTGLIVYWLATTITRDRRVGVVAMLFLAVTPVHAYRVSLGFSDHHPFNYVLMSVTVAGLVGLATEEPQSDSGWSFENLREYLSGARTIWFTSLLAIGVAGNMLAWRGGPLYLVPLGLYVVVYPLSHLRNGSSPLFESVPLIIGIGVGSVLTLSAHFVFGWATPYRAFLPGLLFAGTATVVVIAELGFRRSLSVKQVGLGMGTVALFGTVGSVLIFPWAGIAARAGVGLLADKGVAENANLFAANLGAVFAPVLFFSFILFIAIPAVAIATSTAYRSHRPQLLALVSYTWVFFAVTLIRVRFGGQLAVFTAVFAGYGFLRMTDWLDLSPAASFTHTGRASLRTLAWPDAQTAGSILVLFLLISSFAAVQIPVKQSQIAIGDSQYETARWMADYADDQRWEFPEDYVFSQWGRNRLYNYVVNDATPDYDYARRYFSDFLASTDPERWYERLRERTGFVVTEGGRSFSDASMYTRLHQYRTSATVGTDGLAHYRLVHDTNGGEFRVFTLVPGATVAGTAPANETVTIRTNVSTGGGSFVYERPVRTTMNGRYAVTVPYTGTYDGGDGHTVTEVNVTEGGFVTDSEQVGTWSFEAGRGEYVFDTSGRNHGFAENVSWVSGDRGRALSFDGTGHVIVPDPPRLNGSDGFTYSTRFRTDPNADYASANQNVRLVSNSGSVPGAETDGFQMAIINEELVVMVGNGTNASIVRGPTVADGEWHNATAAWNGDELVLSVDGTVVDSAAFDGEVESDAPLVFGAASDQTRRYVGFLEEVQFQTGSNLSTDDRNRSDR